MSPEEGSGQRRGKSAATRTCTSARNLAHGQKRSVVDSKVIRVANAAHTSTVRSRLTREAGGIDSPGDNALDRSPSQPLGSQRIGVGYPPEETSPKSMPENESGRCSCSDKQWIRSLELEERVGPGVVGSLISWRSGKEAKSRSHSLDACAWCQIQARARRGGERFKSNPKSPSPKILN